MAVGPVDLHVVGAVAADRRRAQAGVCGSCYLYLRSSNVAAVGATLRFPGAPGRGRWAARGRHRPCRPRCTLRVSPAASAPASGTRRRRPLASSMARRTSPARSARSVSRVLGLKGFGCAPTRRARGPAHRARGHGRHGGERGVQGHEQPVPRAAEEPALGGGQHDLDIGVADHGRPAVEGRLVGLPGQAAVRREARARCSWRWPPPRARLGRRGGWCCSGRPGSSSRPRSCCGRCRRERRTARRPGRFARRTNAGRPPSRPGPRRRRRSRWRRRPPS